jgi:hypothetical protein
LQQQIVDLQQEIERKQAAMNEYASELRKAEQKAKLLLKESYSYLETIKQSEKCITEYQLTR